MNVKRFLIGSIHMKAISTQLMGSPGIQETAPPPCVVVFGSPGAGKTTVADTVVELMASEKDFMCLGLDLDACVPQWMRDNFANGIYPTLKQREAFALDCCDFVDKQLLEKRNNGASKLATIISFSFVNSDLRDVFRGRFPHAKWMLVDTSENVATRRINMRQGHFYTGEKKGASKHEESPSDGATDDADNSEWKFAPVSFDHVVLDGTEAVETNAKRVLDVLRKAIVCAENQ